MPAARARPAGRRLLSPRRAPGGHRVHHNQAISNQDIQPVPEGLHLVGGTTDCASTDPVAGLDRWAPERGRVKYFCKPSGASTDAIPDCPGDQRLTMQVFFPSAGQPQPRLARPPQPRDFISAWNRDVQRQWLDRCVHSGNSCG